MKGCIFAFPRQNTLSAMPTYNIIGDIHGRSTWKELVDEDCINIFVGDYFDPYGWFSIEALCDNFKEIIALKRRLPDKVVLLYGNHDYAYLPKVRERNNRYDSQNAKTIASLFVESEDLFHGVAYAIGEDYIVTHAGITKPWKNTYLPDLDNISPSKMEKAVNRLWRLSKKAFSFKANATEWDYCGDNLQHSPIWVRPESLLRSNLYLGTNIIQIVGHTQFKDITDSLNTIFVDCLESVTKSKRIEM